MPFVSSSDSVKIHYEVLGDGDVTLIFVGGWGVPTARKVWRHQLSFSSVHRLVLLDLAGHGKSGKNRKHYTMELFAQDVRAVVEKLDLKNIILIGHSMGGPVILEAERLLSDRVIGLIPLDSLSVIPEVGFMGLEDDVIEERMKPYTEDFIGATTALFEYYLSDKFEPQDVEEVRKTPPTLDRRSMLSAWVELYKWDLNSVLPRITKPIKCIVAGKDFPKNMRGGYNSTFDAVYLEDLGHLLFAEDPKRFNEVLSNCISELLQ
ncbi:MAG: alpha/beta hydrolase [Candidatus Thorarchaeota archaeon]|nr:MAG: alpha/beta hydrolase [Candidatus Thorarchaeota archaeon]